MTTLISGTAGVTFPAGGVGNPAGAVVGTTDSQTLTNKTLTSPTITGASMSSMASSVITSGTAVASTSGTSIDFTSIPSWVKRITVMFNGVSISSTSHIIVQLGAGSIKTSGYSGSSGVQSSAPGTDIALYTTGFGVHGFNSTNLGYGNLQICLVGSNTWVASGSFGYSVTYIGTSGGSVTLSGTLDSLRITTVSGTNTFDAGSINILYE